jgi:phosphoglycerol transferase
MIKNIKNIAAYFLTPLASMALVFLVFDLWKFDLSTPVFHYSQDSLFYLFVVKIIAQTGWFFQNDLVGYPHLDGSFYLHDFPIHADAFNFLVIRFFAFFSKDAFLLTNSFFIFTFAINSLAAFIALRAFKIANLSAALIAILFAFLPYHILRGVWHLFLSNYAAIPLIIMVALWICDGRIALFSKNQKEQISLAPNRLFFVSFLIAIFSAANGVYYAFYGCIIFIFAWFLHGLKSGKFFNSHFFNCVVLCLTVFVSLILLYMPSFIFWLEHGVNNYVGNRDRSNSEFYGLRIIDLLMPITNHYIAYFNNLRIAFEEAIFIEGERRSAALGILASAGFIFSIVWLLIKSNSVQSSFLQRTTNKFSFDKNDENLISNLSSLNLLSLLFAMAGGLVMLFVMSFPLIRSHARFCIFIAFFSLFLIAIFFDKIERKNILTKIALVVIFVLALFDEVGNLASFDSKVDKRVEEFNNDRNFVTNLENILEPNAQVFSLPVFGFPESAGDEYQALILYLHSENLRLSYPAIKGRAADLWQEKVVKLPFKDFVLQLKEAGFSAVVINRRHFASLKENGWVGLRKLEKNFKSLKGEVVVSNDKNWIAFKL